MTKRPRSISPLVDISVPFPSDDVVEIKLIGAAILFVGPVPGRPENERQGAVSPNHVQICRWETLLTPITRWRDDRLMFANHCLEILDDLQRHIVFLVSKIHERPCICTVFGNHDFNTAVWIDRGLACFSLARNKG